jgi:copper chaperone CopZ
VRRGRAIMKNMSRGMQLLAFLAIVGLVSCRQTDVRILKVSVPGMKNAACADLIQKAVATQPGVLGDKIQVDLASRSLTVPYESLYTARKNIEGAIADAGFAANEVPANPEAVKALPPDCRP